MISKKDLYKNKEKYKQEEIDFELRELEKEITYAFKRNKKFLEVRKKFAYDEEIIEILENKGFKVEKIFLNKMSATQTAVLGQEIEGYKISWGLEFSYESPETYFNVPDGISSYSRINQNINPIKGEMSKDLFYLSLCIC